MDELSDTLRELVQATDRYRRVVAAALGIGAAESAALGVLLEHAPLAPSALSRRLLLSPASITGMLDRLEAAGYAVRRRHPGDRRSLLVELTPSGRRATELLLGMFESDVAAALPDLDAARLAALAGTLKGITARFRDRTADPDALVAEVARAGDPRRPANPVPAPSEVENA